MQIVFWQVKVHYFNDCPLVCCQWRQPYYCTFFHFRTHKKRTAEMQRVISWISFYYLRLFLILSVIMFHGLAWTHLQKLGKTQKETHMIKWVLIVNTIMSVRKWSVWNISVYPKVCLYSVYMILNPETSESIWKLHLLFICLCCFNGQFL